MNRFVISCISLLAAICVALLAGVYAYHASSAYAYDDLTFDSFTLDGSRLTFHVSANVEGEYVYRLKTSDLESGKLTVTVLGGKQASLAQTPGEDVASFYIDLPEGTKKVVCGKTTIYTVK